MAGYPVCSGRSEIEGINSKPLSLLHHRLSCRIQHLFTSNSLPIYLVSLHSFTSISTYNFYTSIHLALKPFTHSLNQNAQPSCLSSLTFNSIQPSQSSTPTNMAARSAAQLLAELEAMRKRHLDEQTALQAHHRALEVKHLQKAHATESALLATLLALPHIHPHAPPQTPPAATSPTRTPVALNLQGSDLDIGVITPAPAPTLAPPLTPRAPRVPARLLQAFKQHSGPPLLPHHPTPAPTPSTQPPSPLISDVSPAPSAPLTPCPHTPSPSAKRPASPTGPGMILYDAPRRAPKAAKTTADMAATPRPATLAGTPKTPPAKMVAPAPAAVPAPAPLPSLSRARTLPVRAARVSGASRTREIIEGEMFWRRMSAVAQKSFCEEDEEGRGGREEEVVRNSEGRRALLAERAREIRFVAKETTSVDVEMGEEVVVAAL